MNRKRWKNLFHAVDPDELWETDLTYIPTVIEGMTYLFNIKDCFTKEWMGYYYSRTCNRKDALEPIFALFYHYSSILSFSSNTLCSFVYSTCECYPLEYTTSLIPEIVFMTRS